jgi:hypothetical protein
VAVYRSMRVKGDTKTRKSRRVLKLPTRELLSARPGSPRGEDDSEEVTAQLSLCPWRCGRHGIGYAVNVKYQPLTLADLARLVAGERDFDAQWRLVVEFLKDYHQEPAGVRLSLLEDVPGPVGDERWDVLFAGLAEHLAMRDGQAAPGWSAARGLRRFWFPFDAPGARAQALVHAPAAFRRRGVFVADYEIDAA